MTIKNLDWPRKSGNIWEPRATATSAARAKFARLNVSISPLPPLPPPLQEILLANFNCQQQQQVEVSVSSSTSSCLNERTPRLGKMLIALVMTTTAATAAAIIMMNWPVNMRTRSRRSSCNNRPGCRDSSSFAAAKIKPQLETLNKWLFPQRRW